MGSGSWGRSNGQGLCGLTTLEFKASEPLEARRIAAATMAPRVGRT